jgi:diguanylate cyclase (GGDEF)-like protein
MWAVVLRFRSKQSLPGKLVALLLGACLPLAVYSAWAAWQVRDTVLRERQAEALTVARLAAGEVSRVIENSRQLLAVLAEAAPQDRTLRELCTPQFRKLIARFTLYQQAGFLDIEGNLVCALKTPDLPINNADREYFQRAVQTDDFAVSDLVRSRTTGRPVVVASYPMTGADGRVRGVVFVSLDIAWFQGFFKDLALPAGAIISLVDQHGTIISRQPPLEGAVGRTIPDRDSFLHATARSKQGLLEIRGVDGVERVGAYSAIPGEYGDLDYVRVAFEKEPAEQAALRLFRSGVMVFVIVVLLASVVAWRTATRWVLLPMEKLTVAARRLAGGDHAVRTGLDQSNEFGEVGAAFDQMAAGIEEREQRLAAHAASLERVNRRVKTLSAGNRTLLRVRDEKTLISEMCRVAVEVGGYSGAWVGLTGAGKAHEVAPAGGAGAVEHLVQRACARPQDCAVTANPDAAPLPAGGAGVICFPLRAGNHTLGVLTLVGEAPESLEAEELDLLEEFSSDLAFGIQTARLRDKHDEAERRLACVAYYDSLTDLPNHFALVERISAVIVQATASGRPLSLIKLDVDRFREVNEAVGHGEGDNLLRAFAQALVETADDTVSVFRLAEDTFALLLPGSDVDAAMVLAAKIRERLKTPFEAHGAPVYLSAAAGMAAFPQHGDTAEMLIRRAGNALQRAKRKGLAYAIHTGEPEQASARRLLIATELRQAIGRDELVLFAQPKIDVRSGRVCGAELLARWSSARLGPVSPAEFIPLAEHTGLIQPLTDWVLDTAARALGHLAKEGVHLPVAVNISARNLYDSTLLPKLEEICNARAISPSQLELEITESALMENPDIALEVLSRLRERGHALHVDDFGTGYSSLVYLQKLPISSVKIDQAFIRGLGADAKAEKIVRFAIELGHALNLEVVAEGVETGAVLDALRALDCDMAQGYFIAPPMPLAQFPAFVERNNGPAV